MEFFSICLFFARLHSRLRDFGSFWIIFKNEAGHQSHNDILIDIVVFMLAFRKCVFITQHCLTVGHCISLLPMLSELHAASRNQINSIKMKSVRKLYSTGEEAPLTRTIAVQTENPADMRSTRPMGINRLYQPPSLDLSLISNLGGGGGGVLGSILSRGLTASGLPSEPQPDNLW